VGGTCWGGGRERKDMRQKTLKEREV